MNDLHIELWQEITLHLSPSELLRICIVDQKWFTKIMDDAWWKIIYQHQSVNFRYLPPIIASIPDFGLFCRLALKTTSNVQSVWNPKNICHHGATGEKGDIGTHCGPVGQTGQIGFTGNTSKTGLYVSEKGIVKSRYNQTPDLNYKPSFKHCKKGK